MEKVFQKSSSETEFQVGDIVRNCDNLMQADASMCRTLKANKPMIKIGNGLKQI
jgi:hypothetical protein